MCLYDLCLRVHGMHGSMLAALGGICSSWRAWSECLFSMRTHGTPCTLSCERALPWVLTLCVARREVGTQHV